MCDDPRCARVATATVFHCTGLYGHARATAVRGRSTGRETVRHGDPRDRPEEIHEEGEDHRGGGSSDARVGAGSARGGRLFTFAVKVV